MDKIVLVQYSDMKEEIKDIRRRISDLEKSINKLGIVSDSVKGTRKDGTYGSIKITGYPTPAYYRKKAAMERYRALLAAKEAELLELTCQAEEYIESMEDSELRTAFRLYYIDGMKSWSMVAMRMNQMYPKRKKKFTDENLKKRNQRFFEKIQECPPMSP